MNNAERPIGFQNEHTPTERFDNAREYWKRAINEGRAYDTRFFQHVFNSPDTEILREFVDDEMLMTIAKTLNETWVGVKASQGRIDSNYIILPTPTSTSTASTSGGAT